MKRAEEIKGQLLSLLRYGVIVLRLMLNFSAEPSTVERVYTGQRGSFARVSDLSSSQQRDKSASPESRHWQKRGGAKNSTTYPLRAVPDRVGIKL